MNALIDDFNEYRARMNEVESGNSPEAGKAGYWEALWGEPR